MTEKTKIQWCDSTVNLLIGCDGCELSGGHCYAEALTNRFAGRRGWPNEFKRPVSFMRRLDQAMNWSDLTGKLRSDKPWLNGHPRTIFVNDLSDTFTESVALSIWHLPVWYMGQGGGKDHRWMLLTKRPKRMAAFVAAWEEKHDLNWPENIWCGTSVTSQATVSRVAELLDVNCTNRFVSCEPMLGQIVFPECVDAMRFVIFGGESGSNARPCDPIWIWDGMLQCQARGVAAFVKQLGSHVITDNANALAWPDETRMIETEGTAWARARIVLQDKHGGDSTEWPEELQMREIQAE